MCTIYDIGRHDGQFFIVMELLEGKTLRDCILGKPLSIPQRGGAATKGCVAASFQRSAISTFAF
jgi:hypothetical protein